MLVQFPHLVSKPGFPCVNPKLSWPRGTNEKTNGPPRQRFANATDLSHLSLGGIGDPPAHCGPDLARPSAGELWRKGSKITYARINNRLCKSLVGYGQRTTFA